MTHDQCIDIAVLLLDRCIMPAQNEEDFARLAARYFAVLVDLDFSVAKDAIDQLTRNGMQFVPAPGSLLAAARRAARRQTAVGAALENLRLLYGNQHIDEDTIDAYLALLATVNDDDAVLTAIDRIGKGIDSTYDRFPAAHQIATYAYDLAKRRETSLTADQVLVRARQIEADNREVTDQRLARIRALLAAAKEKEKEKEATDDQQ